MELLVMVMILAMWATPMSSTTAQSVDIYRVRKMAAEYNITCVLVFGDSSVDPGNNNRLDTTFKGNFPPYGKDFFNGQPTGRFSNGRLPTDFIAEALGYTMTIPGYLQPNLSNQNLLHGVSFASAASGYDDLTANLTNVLPVSKQLQYLMHYKIKLRRLVGENRAEQIIKDAIFVISMGTNDFIQNYYIELDRAKQFTVEEYGDYLTTSMMKDIKEMHRIGARRLVVVGVPPLGCMPLVKTLRNTAFCDPMYNHAAFSFNNKVKAKLATLKMSLGMSSLYVDAYGIIQNAVKNPIKFGFTVSSIGCCGTGTIEYGDTCEGMSTCKDASKYVFWDAVHPTEKMYKIIADEALSSLNTGFLD
ncbi:GDSL esterase/lipase [Thalictrum thalictroides]|uniref:GDSL esterase/lipase n=1 Tax=Thalictrum thalictroides TaxID=46969 RepID=A0A7J6X8M1_THATH|nr:GDSL esterase/lipase [Thalictrum thalictroides]